MFLSKQSSHLQICANWFSRRVQRSVSMHVLVLFNFLLALRTLAEVVVLFIDADHSPHISVEVKEHVDLCFPSSIRFNGAVLS
jgi:hypothetical protein